MGADYGRGAGLAMIARRLKGKKGIFFTMIAIAVLVLLFLVLPLKQRFQYRDSALTVETQVHALNEYISNFEYDTGRALFIAGYRSMLGLSQVIKELNGSYLDDFNNTFSELVVNGSFNGTPINITYNASLRNWMEHVHNKSLEAGIVVNASNYNVTIYHVTPWNVQLELDMDVIIASDTNLARWEYHDSVTVVLDIQGFEDPLYTIGSNGVFVNAILNTPFSSFADTAADDVGNLTNHTRHSWYIASEHAPSYLQRFVGDFNSSPYGIESLVHVESLQALGGLEYNKSIVDFYYWDPAKNPTKYRINNTAEWFRLDNESARLEQYNVSDYWFLG